MNINIPCNMPWIVLGDFNIPRYSHEKVGGNPPRPSEMDDFNNCIQECGLLDMHLVDMLNPKNYEALAPNSTKERKKGSRCTGKDSIGH